MRRAALLASAIAAVAIGGVLATSLLNPPPRTGGPEFLALAVETDRATYARGEPIRITTSITNTGSETVTLTIADSCGPLLAYVKNATGAFVFSSHAEASCSQAIVSVPIAPGETLTATFTWDQLDLEGREVSPGTYAAHGQPRGRADGDPSPDDEYLHASVEIVIT
jgi:hypothetical protein